MKPTHETTRGSAKKETKEEHAAWDKKNVKSQIKSDNNILKIAYLELRGSLKQDATLIN